ncbi:DgyrCDS12884 [Dimorphilus gyrociliatus]|uniref:DgyrCDS12884 n=1 Tax=Dimorphilus gyrociliatus TaxID=2664684 RepID=A0A7I8W912_9ANNE|nr:DgyrCDS12884 [Dimorphilus gyrociliatus]
MVKEQDRISQLATPRNRTYYYANHKESVYMPDRQPWQPGGGFATSERLDILAKPKRYTPSTRQNPQWPVSNSAKAAEPSERVTLLASPKPLHREYTPLRQLPTPVPETARKATASPRICDMSKPKKRLPDTIDYGPFEQPIWCVSPTAKAVNSSERVAYLASPKPYQSIFDRDPQTEVSDAAKRGYATVRVQNLAKHKRKIDVNDGYDFYIVSAAARSHRASVRLAELANPNPRRIRQKYAIAKAN